jgi:hypothetical protein
MTYEKWDTQPSRMIVNAFWRECPTVERLLRGGVSMLIARWVIVRAAQDHR